jgi:phytoene dehydrogenase-like protein
LKLTSKSYDALIVGGGHNGLTCACYLAAAGFSVLILERRTMVGGAAVTEEFFPGFRNSTASYTVSLLHPKVISDLRLAEHGLRIIERPISNFLPLSATQHLKIGGSLAATQAEVARHSQRDAERLPDYYAMLERAAGVLRSLLLETPPNAGGGVRDIIALLGAFWICSPRAPATCSTAGSNPMRSRRLSVSTRSSAILQARMRRGRLMCCCTMYSAR